jgi:hypothetical protein
MIGMKCHSCSPMRFKESIFFYYYLVCEAIGTAATPGLLCQPRVIVKILINTGFLDFVHRPEFYN